LGLMRLERTAVWTRRCWLGPNAVRAVKLCRTMELEAGKDRVGTRLPCRRSLGDPCGRGRRCEGAQDYD